jgi:hypothetical protein
MRLLYGTFFFLFEGLFQQQYTYHWMVLHFVAEVLLEVQKSELGIMFS